MDQESIELSPLTEALLGSLERIRRKKAPLEGERFEVSQTVSFFGFVYERIRNSIEFNDEHLIRRLSIARVLRRRLEINKTGKGEGENLARELMWGRYISSDTITRSDIKDIQHIIDSYIYFASVIKNSSTNKKRTGITYNMLIDFMSSEIEESLNIDTTERNNLYLYYFYQTLRKKIHIPKLTDEEQDRYFYVAAERAYSKNDFAFIRYHLFSLKYGPLSECNKETIQKIARNAHEDAFQINTAIRNPYAEKLFKFAKKQAAPFRILYQIIDNHPSDSKDILSNRETLIAEIESVCDAKYKETGTKLRSAAVRSIIYIFLTKMVFVLILEFPLTRYIFGVVDYVPLGINTIFPAIFMGIIVSFINPPSHRNTQRIISRIVDIIDENQDYETKAELFKARETSSPTLLFSFTVIYLLLFTLVFGGIYVFLEYLDFNFISKGIFIFFISVVAFFGYRIRQTSKEYVLETSSNIITSFFGFLFLPILSLGKFLSSQISRINVFIILFDYIIETPFKLLIDIFEEWSRFVKARKDELI